MERAGALLRPGDRRRGGRQSGMDVSAADTSLRRDRGSDRGTGRLGRPVHRRRRNPRAATGWLLASTALVLLMTPGLAIFYGGMVRTTGVLNMIMMSFIAIPLVTVA